MKGFAKVLAAVLPALVVHAEDEATAKPPCALGFCMGQPIDAEPDGNTVGVSYRVVEHAAFNGGVEVHWTRATGVCEVRGYQTIAPRHRTDMGTAHKREFDRLTDLVSMNHGAPDHKVDRLYAESAPHQYRGWLDSLRRGDRALMNFWEADLRDGVDSVVVEATFDGVVVRYQFDNSDACRKAGRRLYADDF